MEKKKDVLGKCIHNHLLIKETFMFRLYTPEISIEASLTKVWEPRKSERHKLKECTPEETQSFPRSVWKYLGNQKVTS